MSTGIHVSGYYVSVPSRHSSGNKSEDVNQVYVREYGSGDAVIVALHAYEGSGKAFYPLAKKIAQHYTLVAPDIPFHGKTQWQSESYNSSDMQQLLNTILSRYKGRSVYLLGYSLGGRILNAVFSKLDIFICKGYTLVAPDGAKGKYTWWVDQLPAAIRHLVVKMIHRPQTILKVSNWMMRLSLLDHHTKSYLSRNLKSKKNRLRLISSLESAANFSTSREEWQNALAKYDLTAEILVGDSDPLISKKFITSWLAPVPSTKLIFYNGGHELPTKQLAQKYVRKMQGS